MTLLGHEPQKDDVDGVSKTFYLRDGYFFPELYLDKQVPVLMSSPSPLTFYRDYVAPNKPVIIQNALGHWEALHKWNSNYFRYKPNNCNVT